MIALMLCQHHVSKKNAQVIIVLYVIRMKRICLEDLMLIGADQLCLLEEREQIHLGYCICEKFKLRDVIRSIECLIIL